LHATQPEEKRTGAPSWKNHIPGQTGRGQGGPGEAVGRDSSPGNHPAWSGLGLGLLQQPLRRAQPRDQRPAYIPAARSAL